MKNILIKTRTIELELESKWCLACVRLARRGEGGRHAQKDSQLSDQLSCLCSKDEERFRLRFSKGCLGVLFCTWGKQHSSFGGVRRAAGRTHGLRHIGCLWKAGTRVHVSRWRMRSKLWCNPGLAGGGRSRGHEDSRAARELSRKTRR